MTRLKSRRLRKGAYVLSGFGTLLRPQNAWTASRVVIGTIVNDVTISPVQAWGLNHFYSDTVSPVVS
ncbi:hypothetical protein HBH96_088060 [Parastagonospora nodorum]|nr:hypothetical protein HBI78_023170 [Parastagonospora nodorum]KAH5059344.1 hypothetical protein HBH96_088060 [Parastagonospora nodorum]